MSDYVVTIKNCNSIDEAAISLRRSALNIKYGPNGIGKSTIARSLILRAQGDGALDDLLPFKYRDGGDHPRPSVEGADEIASVLVFDDHYVSQFVFQPDEVLKNSFEIFINTEEYKTGLAAIESMFEELKDTFSEQSAFDQAVLDFTQLRDAFAVTKSGVLAKTSRGFRALGVSGKLNNIPSKLKGYEGFLQSEDPAGWITWQSKGKAFLDLSENCPFCSTVSVNKDTAISVSSEFESAAVKNMSALRGVVSRLGGYFEASYLERLNEILTSITELSPEQSQFLSNLRGQVEIFLTKLTALRALSFHALREVDDIADELGALKLDLTLLDALDSTVTHAVVDLINLKLKETGEKVGDIRGHIGKQKSRVANLIKSNQSDINEFLDSAGYRYAVRIEPNAESYRMILEHKDAPGHIETAAQHLSYGERNAFALVLFMHHVRRDNPDLVVLDDPVSSFDKTKKFAILHQLFHGQESIRDFTTLLLTHDIEPAIDIVRSGTADQFNAARPLVHFLRSAKGVVTEKVITKGDISTFSQVCDTNIISATDDVIRCIYLRRRFEVHGDKGIEYNLLSNLLHLRDVPMVQNSNRDLVPMDPGEIVAATAAVTAFIPGFDYSKLVQELSSPAALRSKFNQTAVGYEKVQIFRLMSALDPGAMTGDHAFRKFVNESYHIENEYVMQLNPREFDTVPDHIIEACALLMSEVQVP